MKTIGKDYYHGCLCVFPSPPWLEGTARFKSCEQGTVLTAETMTITEFVCYVVEPCLKGKLKPTEGARGTRDLG